ncbi:hypothetical protein [Lonepinella sp. BR2271]|uniref:hypothetical protein n=1 Tax=Lonepinella sp. BR2271 TaxID=3434550 RepID=UPI003F6DAE34
MAQYFGFMTNTATYKPIKPSVSNTLDIKYIHSLVDEGIELTPEQEKVFFDDARQRADYYDGYIDWERMDYMMDCDSVKIELPDNPTFDDIYQALFNRTSELKS